MEASVLIAKILSTVYVSMALGLIFSSDYYKTRLYKIIDEPGTILFGGFFAVLLGFVILQFQNTWTSSWTTMITLVGWISLTKGIILLIFPGNFSGYKNTILKPENLNKILLPILMALGILFGYFGFFLESPV